MSTDERFSQVGDRSSHRLSRKREKCRLDYGSRSSFKAGRGGIRPGWSLPIRPNLHQHAVQVCMDIVNSIGVPVSQRDPEIFLSDRDDAQLLSILSHLKVPHENFLIVNAFSV